MLLNRALLSSRERWLIVPLLFEGKTSALTGRVLLVGTWAGVAIREGTCNCVHMERSSSTLLLLPLFGSQKKR